MKIYKIDLKHNFVEVEPETLDDLWILNLIITEHSLVGSKTTRRFRIEGSNESEKKTVFIKVEISKKELDLEMGVFKLTGITKFGTPIEYVDLNSHHSLDVQVGTKISIEKDVFQRYEIDMLNKAKNNLLLPKIYLLVLDDESTLIAKVESRTFKIISEIKSGKAGKRLESASYRNQYFSEIYSSITVLDKDLVVVAGPGFEKDYFQQFISNKKDVKKFRFTHINSTGTSGLNELLKGGSIKNVLDEFKLKKDSELMDDFFKGIAKEGNVAYGAKEIDLALKGNAIKELLVTDTFLMDNYDKIRVLFSAIEKSNGNYHIITSDSDSGKQLNSIGGIGAFLYYKL